MTEKKITTIIAVPETKRCPHCGRSIDRIYTNASVIIIFKENKWQREELDDYETYQCSECYEELSIEELDELGVPNEVR